MTLTEMIVSRFLFAVIFLKLLDEGFAFLLNRCYRLSSPTLMQSIDFSSSNYWDDFYKKPASQDGSPSTEVTITEWHPSVALEDVASIVPPYGRCLIIGCGDSKLPDVILEQHDPPPPRSLVLLDTSQTCLNKLRERHQCMARHSNGENRRNPGLSLAKTDIEYVCGDVTRLSTYFGDHDGGILDESDEFNKDRKDDSERASFDMIIDKGLTDALLCGEGWDGPVEKLLRESAKVLSMETGQYLLISYELPSSTKRFLVDIGNEIGMTWNFEFDLIPSETREVNIAMATRRGNTPSHP